MKKNNNRKIINSIRKSKFKNAIKNIYNIINSNKDIEKKKIFQNLSIIDKFWNKKIIKKNKIIRIKKKIFKKLKIENIHIF
ncbi:putative 30S ribosomal protein S20 [Candidatus Zinderia insecticola CARI]|uniref:Small ribosomal subunit protein bS20 n=1 Tax=Zinderia insecticola (strain CARI) TaxID=871271 RepID=E4PYU5_ZINIC|nr:putative 30S ribosomal protein S20 [Candidatus Zinderia insecticola CARI]